MSDPMFFISRLTLSRRKPLWIGLGICALLLLAGCAPSINEPTIWLQRDGNEIDTVDPNTQTQRAIIPAAPNVFIVSPHLSPDGKRIAYARGSTTEGDSVWVANADGSNAKKVTRSYGDNVLSFWLTDTSLVVAGSDDRTVNPWNGEMALYDVLTQQAQPLTGADTSTWCGYGSKTTTIFQPHYALGHCEVTGGKLAQIADAPIDLGQFSNAPLSNLSWTSDLKKMAFFINLGHSNDDLFLTSTNSKSLIRLTHFADQYDESDVNTFAMSPDGNWVAFHVFLKGPHAAGGVTGGQIALVGANGQGQKFLIGANSIQLNLVWSPDSKYVAAFTAGTDPAAAKKQLQLFNVATNEARPISVSGNDVQPFDWR